MDAGREPGRTAVWAARLLAALAVVLAGTAVALPLASGLGYLRDLMGTPEVVVGVSFSVTGALLVASPQARRIGWLLLGIGLTAAVYTSALSYTAYVLGGDVEAVLPAGAQLAHVTAWITGWAWFPPWLLVSAVLPQVVPYGRPLPGLGWRVAVAVAVAFGVLGVVTLAVEPGPVGVFAAIDNPFPVPPLARALEPVGVVLDVGGLVLVAVSLASVVVRVIRADRVERRQVGWFGYAVVMAVVIIVAVPSVWINLVVLVVPAGLAVAALRYRLYDLDLVVNRTVVATLLLAGSAALYLALVAWVGALVGRSDGAVPVAAAFAVALLFHPARIRVQRAVDRLFHGRRGDPYALLRDLDRALREADNPRAALTGAVAVVRSGLRLPGVGVVVTLPGGSEVREHSGDLSGDLARIPLELHGEQVGELLAAPRDPRAPLGETDLRVLRELAGPLASAAYALRLSGDLEESHRRLLAAREDERRRLRRDLHDGLGPQLAGVVMGLDVVQSALSRGDAVRAAGLARTATDQARTAVDDVRRLVAGLRPPALDDLGLLGALAAAGPASVPGGPRVTVEADGDLTGLPAAVEVAAYRIVSEALTNAVRHSGATVIEVRLAAAAGGDVMTVLVEDDGAGIQPDVVRGVGLTSMRERATELGGWCTVTRTDRGTAVLAHLPLDASRPQPPAVAQMGSVS